MTNTKTFDQIMPIQINNRQEHVQSLSNNTALGPVSLSSSTRLSADAVFEGVDSISSSAGVWTQIQYNDASTARHLFMTHNTDSGFTYFTGAMLNKSSNLPVNVKKVIDATVEKNNKPLLRAKEKCLEIISQVDLFDEDNKVRSAERVRDVLEIFSEVADEILKDLMEYYGDGSGIAGFLLGDVLALSSGLTSSIKINVIMSYAQSSAAGTRYEAIRAADMLRDKNLHDALSELAQTEKNGEVLDLIKATLRN